MADSSRKLKVPRHEVHVVEVGGVDIHVHLKGVSDEDDILVEIDPPDTVEVSVPDRYHLHLRLAVPIMPIADSVRFKPKTGRLNMRCTADPAAAAEAPAGAPSPAAAAVERTKEQEHQKQALAAAAAAAAAATAAERQQQEQQQQERQQQERQRELEELAAAAEAERRHRQQLLRRLASAASAVVAKQPAAQKQQHKQDEAAAAAAPSAVSRGEGLAAGAGSGSLTSNAPSVPPPPQGGSAVPPSSSATAGSPCQPTEQPQQQVRAGQARAQWSIQLIEKANSEDLSTGLEQIKAVLRQPHANSPAGWINRLWDWLSYCVFYFILVTCRWAADTLESERVPFRPLVRGLIYAVCLAIVLVAFVHLVVSIGLADTVWALPIDAAAFLLLRVSSNPAAVSVRHEKLITTLEAEEVWTLLVKLLLVAVSMAVVHMLWALVHGIAGSFGLLGLLSGVATVVRWAGGLLWSVLVYGWTRGVWDTTLTPKVLFGVLTTCLYLHEDPWHAPYCGLTLTMLQLLMTGGGVSAVGSVATTLLLHTVTSSWAEGHLPSSMRTAWWGMCVLVGSAPVLVSAWATHLGLWTSLVDPVSNALLYLPVTAVKLLRMWATILDGVGVLLLFVMFESRAGLCRTLAAVWAAVRCFGSYTAQVLTLARPVDLGCFAATAVLGCLCGTSLGDELPTPVLGFLVAGLRFLASPVTAVLGLQAACVEASTGVLCAIDPLLSRTLLTAVFYLTVYLLPSQRVLDLKTWVCAVDVKLAAAADSAIQQQSEAHVGTICAVMQVTAEKKADLRVHPRHSWWVDLMLLAWVGFVCWRMWWCFKNSTGVSAAVRAPELERGQRLEAVRQRKEAKAAKRKRQKQLQRAGG